MSSDGKLYKDGTESLEPHIEEFIRLGKCKSFYAFLEIHINRVEKVLLAGVSFTDLQKKDIISNWSISFVYLSNSNSQSRMTEPFWHK